MPLTPSLNKAYTKDNLQRAWLWTMTSADARFKSYFRHIYSAYSLAADQNLENLRERLVNETFRPLHATKIYLPKPSGILRPYSLLCVEDQIVYQALVNVVAERLYPRVRRKYYSSIFGHLYSGKRSQYFYHDWRQGYQMFTQALIDSYELGYKYSASFDLTACYDSIDHSVLKYFLKDIGLESEFCERLCGFLSNWTAHSAERPIYQGHGIPQGPLPSGLLSECVLRYFDPSGPASKVRYFRYVDDIRLLARSPEELRIKLIELDMHSKSIGLFPQTSKIDIHKITNIEEEIKSISHPPEIIHLEPAPDQMQVRMRIQALSRGYEVKNLTRFKYVLASAAPNATLQRRLIQILKRQPHLYGAIFYYLSKGTHFSRKMSEESIELLKAYDLYSVFTAGLIKVLDGRVYESSSPAFIHFCRQKLKSKDPELFAAAASALLQHSELNWTKTKSALMTNNWWARSSLASSVRQDFIGDPSYEALLNTLLRDKVSDVAIVAGRLLIEADLAVRRPLTGIHKLAQVELKQAGLIGKLSARSCYISDIIGDVLGDRSRRINWRQILPKNRYADFQKKAVRWRSYTTTDPTAWVNITDTMNDVILAALFNHDTALGQYVLGNIGSVLGSATSGFATSYPKMFAAVSEIHDRRLGSALSHPVKKTTGKPTSFIKHKELPALRKLLVAGYMEVWQRW